MFPVHLNGAQTWRKKDISFGWLKGVHFLQSAVCVDFRVCFIYLLMVFTSAALILVWEGMFPKSSNKPTNAILRVRSGNMPFVLMPAKCSN